MPFKAILLVYGVMYPQLGKSVYMVALKS